jgi:hypothetical protein
MTIDELWMLVLTQLVRKQRALSKNEFRLFDLQYDVGYNEITGVA